ncbi:MAG TPA: DUF4956 domain-containing protein [Tepiditoga sp.]|nr:DUF4956 domain-containing protein [Thermotogota bacterium]HOO76028.1 DUF4956 domain-containing protein [Tepiditoga sp.]
MNLTTFADVFKKGFLEQVNSVSVYNIIISLVITFGLGLFIFFIYRKTSGEGLYNKSFNLSLLLISLVTTLVILAVTSNVVLSLGMVGALSIVRFRTAIKDPMDIVFMFWSISVGITVGAGLYLLAVLGSLVIGLILYFMNKFESHESSYLLIVRYSDNDTENMIMDKVKSEIGKYKIKSKTFQKNSMEITLEVKLQNGNISVLNSFFKDERIENAVVVSYDGEYIS